MEPMASDNPNPNPKPNIEASIFRIEFGGTLYYDYKKTPFPFP